MSPDISILYVEDEETDAFLMQRAFRKEGYDSILQVVTNGRAAIDYLSGSGQYSDRTKYPCPGLVLLDLNLPEVHGFDVLKWIRTHPVYHNLTVVVFSSSSREEDRTQAETLGADEFVSKPHSPELFRQIARNLHDRCLSAKCATS